MSHSTSAPLPGARNPGIDALRGLAIVLVVLHHIGLRIPLRDGGLSGFLPRRLLSALNFNGYEAVFVFFVISGFLIARHVLERWGGFERIDVRAFYARRAARILPCLLLLVAVLSMLHLATLPDYTIHRDGQTLAGAVVAALGLHLNWYEGRTGYLPGGWDVLWSLSIEEVFYLAFPVVCLLTRRWWVLAVLLVVLALSLPITRGALVDNEIWQEKAYLPGMAAIAMGILGAIITWRFRPTGAVLPWVCIGLGWLGIAAVMLTGKELWHLLGEGMMLVLTISSMILVIGMHWRAGSMPMRGWGWLRSCGRLSYEIYLTHMFIVTAMVRLFRGLDADKQWDFLWYVPAVVMCWALGWLVARYLSIPAERLAKSWWRSERRGNIDVAVVRGDAST